MEYRHNRLAALTEDVKRLRKDAKLDSWNSFVEALNVPQELVPALVTNRPELVRLAKPRAMTEGEVRILFTLIAGLLDTNAALREHAEQLAHLVGNWSASFRQLATIGKQIDGFANFRPLVEESADLEQVSL